MIHIAVGIFCLILGLVNIPGYQNGNLLSLFAMGWCFALGIANFFYAWIKL